MKTFLYLFYVWERDIVWREKERSKIRVVQVDNLRGLLSMRRIDMSSTGIIEFWGVKKGILEICNVYFIMV